jgi:hypothetical protein
MTLGFETILPFLRPIEHLIMGHKEISMTVRYSHLAPPHQLAAVERLAAASPVPQTANSTATEQNDAPRREATFVQ